MALGRYRRLVPLGGHAFGDVAQLARAPALQAGGRGFDSHRLHHEMPAGQVFPRLKLRSPCHIRATVDPCYWHERRSLTDVAAAAGLIVPGHARCSAVHHLQKEQGAAAPRFRRNGRSPNTRWHATEKADGEDGAVDVGLQQDGESLPLGGGMGNLRRILLDVRAPQGRALEAMNDGVGPWVVMTGRGFGWRAPAR